MDNSVVVSTVKEDEAPSDPMALKATLARMLEMFDKFVPTPFTAMLPGPALVSSQSLLPIPTMHSDPRKVITAGSYFMVTIQL